MTRPVSSTPLASAARRNLASRVGEHFPCRPPASNREQWHSFFDLMEEYRDEHPEATDDECFEAVCFGKVQP